MDALRWTDLSIVFQKSMSALSPVHKVGAQMEDVYRVHFPERGQERNQTARLRTVLKSSICPTAFMNYIRMSCPAA